MTHPSNRWNDYRPNKSVWLWSCVGAAALTMIVGFGFGGWVTGGTAQEQTETATNEAVATLAADICTQRVLASAEAASVYAQLDEARSWERNKLLDEGGWTTFANMDEPVSGAASLCATQILASDIPEATDNATAGADASAAEDAIAHDTDANGMVDEEVEGIS